MTQLGQIMINEINSADDDNRLHMDYYNMIASENLTNVLKICSDNLIIHNYARVVSKQLNIINVGQLINEFKFPSCDKYKSMIVSIINNSGVLLKKLVARKNLTYGIGYRDGIFLETNQLIQIRSITTAKIKKRLFRQDKVFPVIKEFKLLKKITHPKEREIAFFQLHDVTLSNEKLFNMNLITSPFCQICHEIQSSIHIFDECINSKAAHEALDSFPEICNNQFLESNTKSLIKRLLFLNKNRRLQIEYFKAAIRNRIDDLETVIANKNKLKNSLKPP